MKTLSFDITVPGECMGGCKKCVVGTIVQAKQEERIIPGKVWDSIQTILDLKEYQDYDYTLSLSRISSINWGSLGPLVHLSPTVVKIAVGIGENAAYNSMVSFLSSYFPKVDHIQLTVAQGASEIGQQIQELASLAELAMLLLKTGKYKTVGINTGVNDVSSERDISDATRAYAKLHLECGEASENRSTEQTTGKKIIDTLEANKFKFWGLEKNKKGRELQQFHKDDKGRIFSITTSVRTVPEGHKGTTRDEISTDLAREESEGPPRRQFMFVGNMVNFHHSHHVNFSRNGDYNASWVTIDDFHDRILSEAQKIGYLQARINYIEEN